MRSPVYFSELAVLHFGFFHCRCDCNGSPDKIAHCVTFFIITVIIRHVVDFPPSSAALFNEL